MGIFSGKRELHFWNYYLKAKERAVQIVNYYNICPDFLITPDDCSRGKPLPDPLLMANSRFSVRPDQSLYMGDMASDFEAAFSAGWHFVHQQGYEPSVNCESYGKKCFSPSELVNIDLFK